jgi:hypothetical protein
MVVVTISILDILPLSEEILLVVTRLVLLPPEELVSSEVPDKSFASQNDRADDSVLSVF